MSDGEGIDGFWKFISSPGTLVLPVPLRNCDECNAPAACTFVIHSRPLKEETGRSLGAAYFCNAHASQIQAMLEAQRNRGS